MTGNLGSSKKTPIMGCRDQCLSPVSVHVSAVLTDIRV